MSDSARESDDAIESHLQRALLAMDEEIRQLQAAALAPTHPATHGTATPLDNEPVSQPTLPVGQLTGDDPSAVRLKKLRQTLELLNGVTRPESQTPGLADESQDNHLLDFTLPPRYEVVTKLGQGGFGIVVLAIDKHLKRRVAIKLPKPDMLLTKRMVARFLREAQHVAQLDHPNIIPVLGTDETAPLPFIVYHYCHGPTLAQWLSQQRDAVPCQQAVHIVVLLAEAIHHAHQRGVLHRDLKPSNILLELATTTEQRQGFQDGEAITIPRITDFGISKIFNEDSGDATTQGPTAQSASTQGMTTLGAIVGTLQYMAPEQIRGEHGNVGWHSDVYSLGVILYELLTRRRPYAGDTSAELLNQMNADAPRLRRLRSDASRDLEAIVARTLNQRIEDRYGSALELADDLHRYLDGRNVKARPQSTWSRWRRWSIRQPVVAALSGLCCLLLVVASVMAVSYFRQIQASLAATAAANHELTFANEQARAARDEATKLANELSKQLYVADMTAAADALRKKDILRYQPIIDKYLPSGNELADAGHEESRNQNSVANIIKLDQLRDAAWRYLWNLGHRQGATLASSTKTIHHLCYDNSQQMLAMCGGDGLVRLFDAKSLAEVRSWPAGQGELRSVAFSVDDALIASLGERGSVSIWNVNTGEHVHRFETQAKQAYQIVWQDADTVITTANDTIVHIWNWRTGEETGQLVKHSRGIEGLAISKDRQTLVSAGDDGQTFVWNLADKSLVHTLENAAGRITDVVFCQTQPWIFACDILGKTRRLSLTSEPNTHAFVAESLKAAEAVACSPNGRLVACGSREGVIKIAALTADGQRLKASTEFGDAWQAHQGRINDLQFSPDGKSLLSVGQDGQLKLWNCHSPTNQKLDAIEAVGTPTSPEFIAELKDDRCLVSMADTVFQWHPSSATLELLGEFPSHTQLVTTDPKSSLVFTSQLEKQIIGWRIAQRNSREHLERLWTYQLDAAAECKGLAYCPQRHWLAAATNAPEHELQILDAATGAAVRTQWKNPELVGRVSYLSFSPSGQHLAAIYGKRIGIWNADTGEATILSGHADSVSALAYDHNGQRLASGAEDRCIRLWNVANGELIKELRHHQDEITSVIFAPDGKSLLSCDRAGQTLIWNLDTLTLSLELDKQPRDIILCRTWQGNTLFRLSEHRWLHADVFELPKQLQ